MAWRIKSGTNLDYIESWHAIAESNRIFYRLCWSSVTIDLREVSREKNDKSNQWQRGALQRAMPGGSGCPRRRRPGPANRALEAAAAPSRPARRRHHDVSFPPPRT